MIQGRDGRTSLFTALDIFDSSAIGRNMQPRRHQEFSRYFLAVGAELPQDKAVHVIVENYATHKQHKSAHGWPGTHAGPSTSCRPRSWLNAVESFFAILAGRRSKNCVFQSVIDL